MCYYIIIIVVELFCEFGYLCVFLCYISEKVGVLYSLICYYFGSKEKIWYSISDGLYDYMICYM